MFSLFGTETRNRPLSRLWNEMSIRIVQDSLAYLERIRIAHDRRISSIASLPVCSARFLSVSSLGSLSVCSLCSLSVYSASPAVFSQSPSSTMLMSFSPTLSSFFLLPCQVFCCRVLVGYTVSLENDVSLVVFYLHTISCGILLKLCPPFLLLISFVLFFSTPFLSRLPFSHFPSIPFPPFRKLFLFSSLPRTVTR
jgi:hypothetical protein